MQGTAYCEAKVRKVRVGARNAGLHEIAVLTAANVSPEHLYQAKLAEGNAQLRDSFCPWCAQPHATFEHVAWRCNARPFPAPPRPVCAVEARLGWGNATVLQHLVRCREACLQVRHGRAAREGGPAGI